MHIHEFENKRESNTMGFSRKEEEYSMLSPWFFLGESQTIGQI